MMKAGVRGTWLGTTMLSGAVASLLAATAMGAETDSRPATGGDPVLVAQNNATPAAPSSAPAEPAAPEAAAKAPAPPAQMQEVVITGSRIRQKAITTSSPITIISDKDSRKAGLVAAADILQGNNVASGSGQINGLFTGFVTDGGPGISTVSLRGLGPSRSLVLLNGRRLSPAGTGGTAGAGVDLNVLPNSIRQRIEILKDGASSVYGSDAVAGVVNLITKTNYDGSEVSAYVSKPFDSNGEEYSADALFGQVYDKGSFMVSAEVRERRPLYIKDRDWSSCGAMYYTRPSTGERVDRINPATGNFQCYGLQYGMVQTSLPAAVTTDRTSFPSLPFAVNNYVFITPDASATGSLISGWRGLPFASVPALNADGTVARANGPDARLTVAPQYGDQTLIAPLRTYTVTGFGNYDIDALDAEFYTELLYNRRESSQRSAGQFFPTILPTHPDFPINATTAPTISAAFRNRPAVIIAPLTYNSRQEVDFYRAVTGLRGELKDGFLQGWNWDAFYSYARSDATYSGNRLINDRVLNSLDAIRDTSGNVVCRSATARAQGCVPLRIFERRFLVDGIFTPQEAAYVSSQETGTTKFDTHLVNASITGDLYELPAGKIATALGFEVRRERIDDQPSPNSQIANIYGFTSAGATKGTENVYEAYGELEIPLISKLPWVESLTYNGSARYTRYSESGFSNWTHKTGLNWVVTPEWQIRSTYGTSFRGPKPYELFLGGQTAFTSTSDPCTRYGDGDLTSNVARNCAAEGLPPDWAGFPATPQVIVFGNKGRLTAETAKAFTVGTVITPEAFDLRLSVDYFRIQVNDQIDRYGSRELLRRCYDDANFRRGGTLCDFISPRTAYDPVTRTGGQITLINDSYFNLNKHETSGLDITVEFTKEFDFGEFSTKWDTTRTFTEKESVLGGDSEGYNGTFSDPRWVSTAQFQFEKDDWTLFWQVSYVGPQSNRAFRAPPNNNPATSLQDWEIERRVYHNASISYEADKWEITIGMRNISNEKPDAISFDGTRIGAAGFTTQLEPYGRSIFSRAKFKF
jgi:iron complex outermembrane recepter protein